MSVADFLKDYDYFVYGFHGTTAQHALNIRLTKHYEFRPSNNYEEKADEEGGDWLGNGFYFWQDAPARVWEWLAATRQARRFPPPHEVLVAKVRLVRCLDLLDTRWHADVRRAFQELKKGLRPGEKLPRNKGTRRRAHWHRRDDAVLRLAVQSAAAANRPFFSVRGAFEEGQKLFPGSALYDLAHVELAVLEDSPYVIEPVRWLKQAPAPDQWG